MKTSSLLHPTLSVFTRPFGGAASLLALLALAVTNPVLAQTTTAWSGSTDSTWSTAGNWGSGVPSATSSALFNSTFSNQPTLTANQTAQGLWLATGAGQDVTINSASAQTLTITGNATLDSRANAGIYMNDSGNHTLTIGPNTSITLTNNTTFYNQQASGALNISGGLNLNGRTLTIGNGTASTGNVAISGNISGATTASILTINSTGTVTLSGNNSYVGQTNLTSNSTLVVGSNTALGVGTFSAGTTGSNTFQASTDVVLANAVNLGNGNTTFSGSNNITFTGNSPSLAFIGGGDKLMTNNLASGKTLTFSGNYQLNSAGTSRKLTIGGTGNTTFSGVISDSALANGVVAVTSTGITTLSGNNTYTGQTTVASGATLRAGNTNSLGFGGVTRGGNALGNTTVSSGGVLDLNGATGVSEPIILNGTGISSGGALINSSGSAASIGSGIAGITVAANTGSGSGLSAAPTITISGTGTGAAATALLGLTTASFTINGGTTVYSVAPTVTITGGGGAGATATAILTGGVVTGITVTNAGNGYTGAPTIAFSGGTVTTLGANATGTGNAGNFTVSGIQMTAAGSGYTGTPTIGFSSGGASATPTLSSVTLAANSSIGGSGDITINAVIGESGGNRTLTKVGAGNLNLAAANTYNGSTTVSAGTLTLSNQNALQNSTLTPAGGTVVFDSSVSGNAFTVGGLAGNTTLDLRNNAGSPAAIALTVGANNGNSTSTGSITGSGSLIKTGTGALTLSGNNNYTGGTTINSGTVLVSISSNFTTGSGSLGNPNSGNLTLNNGVTLQSTSPGTGISVGAPTINLAGDVNIGSATSGRLSFTGIWDLGGANRTITLGRLSGTAYASGSEGMQFENIGGITPSVQNAGTGGALTFASSLTANATNPSVLSFNAATSFANNTGLTIGDGVGIKARTASFFGTGTNAPALTLLADAGKGGGVLQMGDGFSGNNSVMRNAEVHSLSGGGLVSASNTSGNATTGTLTISNGNGAVFSGNIVEGGTGIIALIKTGAGTQTLSGNNTYTGGTTVTSGTLLLTNGSGSATGSGPITVSSGAVLGGSGSASGATTVNGGTVGTSGSTLALTGTLSSTANSTIAAGSTVNVTGGTTVSSGLLAVNGTLGGATSVSSGATLGGSGTVGGATTIDGNLTPGNSPGLLTFSSSLTLTGTSLTTMEINGNTVRGTDYDGINVGAALSYGGNLTLTFGTTFSNGTYSFNLFDSASQSGNFAGVTLTGLYSGTLVNNLGVWGLTSGDNTWSFSQATGDLGLTVVPEPSTWALVAVSLTAAVILRRRRNA